MAAYTVTHKQLLSNYAVLQTLTPNDLVVGGTFTVGSVAVPFNGSFTVYDLPEYLFIGVDDQGDLLFNYEIPVPNQVLYACTGTDVQRTASTGTITFTETCTWITAAQIEDWLGTVQHRRLTPRFLRSARQLPTAWHLLDAKRLATLTALARHLTGRSPLAPFH